MPLRKGSSPAVVSENIREFHTGKTYAHTRAKFGAKKARAQAIAVALSTARRSKAEGGPIPFVDPKSLEKYRIKQIKPRRGDEESELDPTSDYPIPSSPNQNWAGDEILNGPQFSYGVRGPYADGGTVRPLAEGGDAGGHWSEPFLPSPYSTDDNAPTVPGLAKAFGTGSVLGGIGLADIATRTAASTNPFFAVAQGTGYYDKAMDWINSKAQELHKPANIAEERAQTLGEFAPGLISGGEGDLPLAARALTRWAAPAAASQAAGEATKGTSYEGAARVAAGLVGGLGAEGFARSPAGPATARAASGAYNAAMPTGSAGIFGGRLATGANLSNLTAAEKMRAAGISEGNIYRQTGWFWDRETKVPMFEIPDQGARLTRHVETDPIYPDRVSLHPDGDYLLGDVLNHDRLYSAYPWLKNIRVEGGDPFEAVNAGTSEKAAHANLSGTPRSSSIKIWPAGPSDFLDYLLHEIQHIVQFHEGMSPGGSWHDFIGPQARSDMQALEGLKRVMVDTLQKKGINPSNAEMSMQRYAAYKQAGQLDNLPMSDRRLIDALKSAPGGIFDNIDGIVKANNSYNSLYDAAFANYMSIYGEAMARNVVERRKGAALLNQIQHPHQTLNPQQTIPGMRRADAPMKWDPALRKQFLLDQAQPGPPQAPPPAIGHNQGPPLRTEPQNPTPNELGFYHKSEDIALNGPKSATPEEWMGIFRNRQLKADEDKWVGISDWLKNQSGKVSKEDLLDHIRSNAVRLKETVAVPRDYELASLPEEYGGNPNNTWDLINHGDPITLDAYERLTPDQVRRLTPEQHDHIHQQIVELSGDEFNRRAEAHQEHYMPAPDIDDMGTYEPGAAATDTKKAARWDSYQLPGGYGYREIKLGWDNPPKDEAHKHPFIQDLHFPDDANLMGHMRVQDREINGTKTLNMLENQSDWHQEGSQHGYMSKSAIQAESNRLHAELELVRGELDGNFEKSHERVIDLTAEESRIQRELNELQDASHAPPAPFAKTWDQMLFRRFLRKAAEEGYEQVSWAGSPDVVQAIERWPDLRQEGNRWVRGQWGNVDLSPIVNRYLKDMPKYGNKIGESHGVKVQPVKDAATGYTFNTMRLTPEFKKALLSRGFEQFKRGGKIMMKRPMGGSIPFHLRGYNESIGAPMAGSEPGVRHFTSPHTGMIHGTTPGRTDKLNMNVKGGSYIMPASVVSGIGQGNSQAGSAILNSMFKMGPYGSAPAKDATPKVNYGKMAPMKTTMPSFKMPKFKAGGTEEDHGNVPIVAAGGEWVVPPEVVRRLGGGSLSHGHRILDAFVMHLRKKTIQDMKNEKPPKK